MPDPITASAFLYGTWVTSFASFVHNRPNDPNNIPQLPAYERNPGGHWVQSDGYMLAATILCLRFDDNNGLIGKVKINRGGRWIFPQPAITGTYNGAWNTTLHILEGEFTTDYPNDTDPTQNIHLTYDYMAKAADEIEWLWISATKGGDLHRHSVTRGTLRRVPDPPTR
jgi:hypothetical protein